MKRVEGAPVQVVMWLYAWHTRSQAREMQQKHRFDSNNGDCLYVTMKPRSRSSLLYVLI